MSDPIHSQVPEGGKLSPITEEEVQREWGPGMFGGNPHYLTYLVEILNGEKSVETVREDILSFREADDEN